MFTEMSIPVFGMSDPEFKNALKHTRLAIVPVGSLEQHGPHLPVSTDSIIVEHVARLVGERVRAFVLPVLAYGVSFEHSPMFNLSINSSVLSELVLEICLSLSEMGIRRVVILNGHHGNTGALQYISQMAAKAGTRGLRAYAVHYWQHIGRSFDHAGEVETSLVLAIAPELVKMRLAVPNSKPLSRSKTAYDSITNLPGSFPKITGNGVWGDPRKARASTGGEIIENAVGNIARTIAQLV